MSIDDLLSKHKIVICHHCPNHIDPYWYWTVDRYSVGNPPWEGLTHEGKFVRMDGWPPDKKFWRFTFHNEALIKIWELILTGAIPPPKGRRKCQRSSQLTTIAPYIIR